MKLPIDGRSESGVTVKQQKLNFELFIPSLGRIGSGSTTARQREFWDPNSRNLSQQKNWRTEGVIEVF